MKKTVLTFGVTLLTAAAVFANGKADTTKAASPAKAAAPVMQSVAIDKADFDSLVS